MGEQQLGGLLLERYPFLSIYNNNIAMKMKKKSRFTLIKGAVAVSNSQTRDRIKLKQLFQDANQRCRTSPYEGLSFTLDDFLTAIQQFPTPAPTPTKVNRPPLGIGSLVTGTVESLKPYGAFIHIGGGISGLLHVTQISHHRVSDITTLLQPGDTLKVIILSYDPRLSLSTKILEPTPGDMIRNPSLVFLKAEEMAQTFSQRIAEAEALARANIPHI